MHNDLGISVIGFYNIDWLAHFSVRNTNYLCMYIFIHHKFQYFTDAYYYVQLFDGDHQFDILLKHDAINSIFI